MTDTEFPDDETCHVGVPRIGDQDQRHGARHDIFFAAVKTTRMPMIVTDPRQSDNPIVFCNEAFTFMTGYEEREILGSNCRFLQGPETDRAVIDQVRAAISTREEIAVEVLNYRKNGSTFWSALFVSPVYSESGELLYFFGSQLDISRRREAEEALNEAQKMEAVGRLTGGIAHDFNNLLQVILGYVDILGARVAPDDRSARRAVEAVASAATRGATLTQQLLAFARKQELRDRLLNFNSLIQDVSTIIDRTAGDDVEVRRNLANDLWNCRVDPVQAETALLNILANARDVLDNGGTITIETRNVTLRDDEAEMPRRLAPGDYVVVSVSDNGPGVDSAIVDKVFDPFFTTKERGKGSGLGLAMVYGFMRQSRGLVTVSAGPEGGASFNLYFPRASGMPDQRATATRPERTAGARERVLMAEDQDDVGELGRSMLTDLGYAVTLVDTARAALDELARDANYQLVFTDILMPGGMNGVGLAQAVKRDYPHIGVLLTTGFADEAIDEGSRSFKLIRKPYRRAELDERIRAVLTNLGART